MGRFVVFLSILLMLNGCFKEKGKIIVTVFIPNISLVKISDNAIIYIDGVKKASSMGGSIELEVEEGNRQLKIIYESKYYKYIYEQNIFITNKTSINLPVYFKKDTTIIEKSNIKEIKKLFSNLSEKYNLAIKLKKESKLNEAEQLLLEVKKLYEDLLSKYASKIYFEKHLKKSDYIKISIIQNTIKDIEIEKLFNNLSEKYNLAIKLKKELKLNEAKKLLIEVKKSYMSLLSEYRDDIYFEKYLKKHDYIKISIIQNAIKNIENKLQKPHEIIEYIFNHSNDFKLLSHNADCIIATKIRIGDISSAMSYINFRNFKHDLNYLSAREQYLFSDRITKALVDNFYFDKALEYINNQKDALDFIAREWNYKEVYYRFNKYRYELSLKTYNKSINKKTNKTIIKKKTKLPKNNMDIFKKRLIVQYMHEKGRLKTYKLLKDIEQRLKAKKSKNTVDFCNLAFDYYTVVN